MSLFFQGPSFFPPITIEEQKNNRITQWAYTRGVYLRDFTVCNHGHNFLTTEYNNNVYFLQLKRDALSISYNLGI